MGYRSPLAAWVGESFEIPAHRPYQYPGLKGRGRKFRLKQKASSPPMLPSLKIWRDGQWTVRLRLLRELRVLRYENLGPLNDVEIVEGAIAIIKSTTPEIRWSEARLIDLIKTAIRSGELVVLGAH